MTERAMKIYSYLFYSFIYAPCVYREVLQTDYAISVMTQEINLPLEGVMIQQTYIRQQQGHQDCQLLN
jgi:hypothetical protein